MRASYTGCFNSLESMHSDVVSRIAVGNSVVDHEQCVLKCPGQEALEVEAIAIYKVWDGKIQEVYSMNNERLAARDPVSFVENSRLSSHIATCIA